MRTTQLLRASSLVVATMLTCSIAIPAMAAETECNNRVDDDGDSMPDCADSDCADSSACQPDDNPENSNARCSDWVDNDNNGAVDCDDVACNAAGITACQGSWDTSVANQSSEVTLTQTSVPQIGEGMSAEDMLGTMGDLDGEHNDLLCSDGQDNDGDGRTDCADFGCRFSSDVSVCRGDVSMRFSIVGNVAETYDVQTEKFDTRFTKLQLRSFGPIPLIQDSFFLVSMRAEKTPRLTFAMFQIPIGGGHYLNINSGGGGLSNALIVSTAKQLLMDPAYYLYSAFEQGNGAAIEVGGPVPFGKPGMLSYRLYGAGGSGRFAGNVGGRYFTYDNTNYTYSVGAQLGINVVGHYSRWDSPFLMTPSPATVAFRIGGKFDQRAQERYPAMNVGAVMKWNRLILTAESYSKWELNYESTQHAYNVTAGVLLWPKRLMLAADIGQFMASEFGKQPETLETDLKKIRDETKWRVAMHYYFFSNIGMFSLVYSDDIKQPRDTDEEADITREFKLVASYRF